MNQKRILLADDDQALSKLYSTVLERQGYIVIPAHDGEEAYELAVKNKPDVVIIDISMPKRNGVLVSNDIRQTEWGKKTPIVLLTGREVDEIGLENIMKVEPTFYFMKGSGSTEEFVAKIKDVLEVADVQPQGETTLIL